MRKILNEFRTEDRERVTEEELLLTVERVTPVDRETYEVTGWAYSWWNEDYASLLINGDPEVNEESEGYYSLDSIKPVFEDYSPGDLIRLTVRVTRHPARGEVKVGDRIAVNALILTESHEGFSETHYISERLEPAVRETAYGWDERTIIRAYETSDAYRGLVR